jgi:hypothetical protein
MGRDGSVGKLPEYGVLVPLSVAVTGVGKLRPAGRIQRGKLLRKFAYIIHNFFSFVFQISQAI